MLKVKGAGQAPKGENCAPSLQDGGPADGSRILRSWIPRTIWLLACATVVWMTICLVPNPAMLRQRFLCNVPWQPVEDDAADKICITMLSDHHLDSIYHRKAIRDFSQAWEIAWDNKMQYARKHGYYLLNASDVIDIDRPPSWSKILAVRAAFKEGCEWVFWMDPDSLIMNSERRVEDIIPADPNADLVISQDLNGFNAGIWIMRNSEWSEQFLAEWWSMESFILEPGKSLSGDNAALRDLLKKRGKDSHVFIPPQCAINSYTCRGSSDCWKKRTKPKFRLSNGLYGKGDFVLHFAGFANKLEHMEKYSQEAL